MPPSSHQPRPGERPLRSLWGGWRLITDDPVGILLPSAVALLLGVLSLAILRRGAVDLPLPWEDPAPWGDLARLAVGLAVIRALCTSPLRARILAVGAGTIGAATDSGRPVHALRSIPSLLVVDSVIAVARGLAWMLLATPGVAIASVLLGHGAVTAAVVVLAIALVLAALAGLTVRVLLAYAPVEAVVGGHGPIAALRRGLARGRGDRLAVAVLLVAGDLATGVGGVLCAAAGALPGYPLGPLALLHRFEGRRRA